MPKLNQVVSVTFEEATIEEALHHLSEQSGLGLYYARDEKMASERISLRLNNVTVLEAFDEVIRDQNLSMYITPSGHLIVGIRTKANRALEGTGLRYTHSQNRQLVLSKMPVEEMDNMVQDTVSGQVIDAETGEALPGVNIFLEGTTTGTITDANGNFELIIPTLQETLVFTYIGYERLEVPLEGRTELNIDLIPSIIGIDELVVVGYGVQRRSDLTGSVSSIPRERLEMVPNLNISQAIQGAVPGVMVQTTSAGAAPSEVLMIRGRNSITASNTPLIVIDGVPYGGNLMDINPNDIQSIEVLKDASAAAIYGSRGANGVILLTTKEGTQGATRLRYDSHFSFQRFTNWPDVMNGEEFFNFREERFPGVTTLSELEVLESGNSLNWRELAFRRGFSHEHNLSASGAIGNTTYYLGGGFLNVQGIAVNDGYQRLSGRINLDTQIADWLAIGTRTQLSYEDRSGSAPDMGEVFYMNPNTRVRDDNGHLLIYPWPEDIFFGNPLAPTLYENINEGYHILTNNYAVVDFPFIDGLSYRLNIGVRNKTTDQATYRRRDTKAGFEAQGSADLTRGRFDNTVIENIVSLNRDFGVHNVFATTVFGYEKKADRENSLTAQSFPNDFLTFYSAGQADAAIPSFTFEESTLISQMMRLNYSYDSRYLITLTGRRDGFSGFGVDNKWGLFPSIALAWNSANEDFFPWRNVFSELKPRVSFGLNGNQAVSPFQSLDGLESNNTVALNATQAGFIPSRLGQENLGWETSRTLNIGLDFGLHEGRVSGAINLYNTNTTDLLLARTISSVHGITSILQNIGETQNQGLDFAFRSRNITTGGFMWTTSGNMAYVKNEIVDLYGDRSDDVANAWFIGQPIRANYDFIVDGIWQLDEADEAAEWGSRPGFVKLRDINGDGLLTGDDRQIIGQQDPKVLWGITNLFYYRHFSLVIFLHGVHGVTRANPLKTDLDTFALVRRNAIKKDWWTPDNPTNSFVMNHLDAERMSGIEATWYEDAGFVRVKDISLSYDVPANVLQQIGINGLRVYVTGRNLYTFTKWGALDPELSSQRATPLQREFVFGVTLEL